MGKKKTPKLLVMFDTNVLYTQVASDLVQQNVKKIIQENSSHPDLEIIWYLPEMVINERKHQMIKSANTLLPSMQKLEKLLGHKFGIESDTLELHVDKAIDFSKEECDFQVAIVDTNDIDWEDVISRSVKREPPFEDNEKEKGFRDAIIANSFFQLHKKSPSTPSTCRLALVSKDEKLREYVNELTAESKNVRILTNLDELENLINTLVSTVTEEFAAELAVKAGKLFFEKENDKVFYIKGNVGAKIREQYSTELNNTIIPDHLRDDLTWWIMSPIFIKKDGRRIHWMSVISPEFEIFHYVQNTPQQNPLAALSRMPVPKTILGLALDQKKVVDLSGREKFEVYWSTNLTQAQNLTQPKLEKIEYLGNDLTEQ